MWAMKLHFFPVCILYIFSVFLTTSPLGQKQHVLLVACGKAPVLPTTWLIPAELCAMSHFPHLPWEWTHVWIYLLLHRCWFSRDQKFHQYVCTICPNVRLNSNGGTDWSLLPWPAATVTTKSLFSRETKTEVLPKPPPNPPTNVYRFCAPHSFVKKPVPCSTMSALPSDLISGSAQLCCSSSGNFILHLRPWERGGGMHKDFWSPRGMAPGFCNHWLFRKAGQIKSNLLS